MNTDEALALAAQALRREYEGYNLPGALQDLEDRIITAEVNTVAHPHPATRQNTGTGAQDKPQEEKPPSVPGEHGWVDDWSDFAACKGTNPDELFTQGAAQNRAKLICHGCPVRTECLADALDNDIEFGIWGGMTERERRALLRRRPDVASWRELLMKAMQRFGQRHEFWVM
jgi:WhiB family redox-sensing transcriptional regulator